MGKTSNIAEASRLLWKSFKKGNQEAFAQLFKSYYSDLYYYGIKLIGQDEVVKDELQEFFAELWERRENLSEINHVKAYLIKSFRRKLLKTTTRNRKSPVINAEFKDDAGFELSIEELIIQDEKKGIYSRKLKSLLNKLNQSQKEIIYLKFYNNLDYKDIAEITGLKYQSVRNSMHKALKMLREAF